MRPARSHLGPWILGPWILAACLLTACGTGPSHRDGPTTTTLAHLSMIDAACRGRLVASTTGVVASTAITELSGLVASRRVPGMLWAHNDSGDSARIFAVGTDGADLGEYVLEGANAVDWEDIAAGPGPDPGQSYLFIGDIGDNAGVRRSVQVYRVPEPVPGPVSGGSARRVLTGVTRWTFVYPDGPHDAEALLVDPLSGEIFILTKTLGGTAQVFRAPANLADTSTTTLTQVATIALGLGSAVTAADVSPSGDLIALRTYFSVVLFPRTPGTPLASAFAGHPCDGQVVSEPQGESIAFTRDGRGYITASEGTHPELHAFVAP